MYFVIVIATTIVLPIGCALIELWLWNSGTHAWDVWTTLPLGKFLIISFLGKWYVFWAGGVRLMLAGMRQTFTPAFTLKQIFEIDHKPSEHIVQELGFANLSMGMLCLVTLALPVLLPAGALTAGLYYGLAGLQHIRKPDRNAMRLLAMLTDLLVFAMLAVFWVAFVMTPAP